VEKKKNGCVRITKNSGKSCRPAERILQYKRLITATYLPHKKKLLIKRLQQNAVPIFIFIRLQQQQLFRQRKIKIALPFHQVEVSLPRWLHYYLTNENFVRKPIFNSPQQLHSVDLSAFLASYLIK
jgi:hypothetical protein